MMLAGIVGRLMLRWFLDGLLVRGGDDIVLQELRAKALSNFCVGSTSVVLFGRHFSLFGALL